MPPVRCLLVVALTGIVYVLSPNTIHAQDDAADANDESRLLEVFVGEFVPIRPGSDGFPRSFEMGSVDGDHEQPVHQVSLPDEFLIAKYEVPQDLYAVVMDRNPSRWQGPRNSAERMTWTEANEFCRLITARLQDAELIDADEVIRLPSESEWEYCCRAGTSTAYSFGEHATMPGDEGTQASRLDLYAWHTGNAAGNDPPVGALKPNPWGLYDVHGYLWEFTADDWHDNYADAPTDGAAWTGEAGDISRIVLRGGSWKDASPRLRSTARRAFPRDDRDDAVGFRCVRARVP